MKRFTAVLALVVILTIAVSPTAYADSYTEGYWDPWGEEITNLKSDVGELYEQSPGLFILASPWIVAGSVAYVALVSLPFAATTLIWSGGWVIGSIGSMMEDGESSDSD
jgi:hypothetical protein